MHDLMRMGFNIHVRRRLHHIVSEVLEQRLSFLLILLANQITIIQDRGLPD